MKQKIIISTALALLLCYSLSAQQRSFSIDATVSGVDNRYAYLYSASNDKNRDSVKVENGELHYEGTLAFPDFFYIRIPGKKVAAFFFYGGKLTIKEVKSDSLAVDGEGAKEWYEYLTRMEPLTSAMQLNRKKMGKKKSMEERQPLIKEYYQIDSATASAKADYIRQHPKSDLSAFLIAQSYQKKMVTSETITLYNALSNDVKQSEYGKRVKEDIDYSMKVGVGVVAPAFTIIDKDGKKISLSDYKGKYVLLDFWGSWCAPCRASHPHLVELYNKYKSDKFEIIGLAGKESNREKWLGAIVADKLTWPQANIKENDPDQELAKTYAIAGYPTKILINPQGVVIARSLGSSAEIDQKLKKIFDK